MQLGYALAMLDPFQKAEIACEDLEVNEDMLRQSKEGGIIICFQGLKAVGGRTGAGEQGAGRCPEGGA